MHLPADHLTTASTPVFEPHKHTRNPIEMDLFSSLDSFFTILDSLAFLAPTDTPSSVQQDFPVEFDTPGGGNANCVVA